MVAMTFGQSRRISGQVLNSETNEAIAGASVSEKATNGTVTDASGHFSLNIPSVSNVTLIISHTGYSPQQVVVENQVDLVIKLVSTASQLDEVVVVGYGERRKRDVTGALSSVQSKDIVRANPVLAAKAIQGQVAGATVTKASNRPGAPYNITIRGENTINNSTQPLIVIDGLMGGISTRLIPTIFNQWIF